MNNQFYRIYLIIIVTAAIIILSFGKLYDSVNPQAYLISVESIFNSYQNDQKPSYKPSSLSIDTIPLDLQEKLYDRKIIAFQDEHGQVIYCKLNMQGDLVEFGPFESTSNEEQDGIWILVSFYSALALLLGFFLRPIFIDLQKLQNGAAEFSKTARNVPICVKKGSRIFPLVSAFNKMSVQISDFVDLHKDLSRTVAHEIRTPLSRMKFVNEALSQKIEVKHYQRIQSDIKEIEELVEDYLSFAKIESQQDIFEKTEENILLWLSSNISKFSDNESGVMVSLQCKNDFAFFQSKFLARALQNLIVNAMHFAETSVRIRFYIEHQTCYLEVIDDGPGLPGNSKKLFRAFKRQSGKNRYEGFGLGLYITRKVAIWHGGRVSTTSSKKLGGAKFVIEWPNCI